MKNKIFALLAVLLLACAVPCTAFADDSDTVASIATSESAEELQSISDGLKDGIDAYDGGISIFFQWIKDTWSQVIAGPAKIAVIFGSWLGDLFTAVPVFEIALLVILFASIAAGILRILWR